MVYVQMFIHLSGFSKGTASGSLQITGFPFTAEGQNDQMLTWSVYDTPLPTSAGVFPMAGIAAASTLCNLYLQSNNDGTNASWPDPDSNSQYKLSGCYQTST
jgi:hypothetical protein